MNPTRKILFFFLLFLAFTGGILFMYQGILGGRAQPEFATVWPSPMPLAEFSLVDQNGDTFTRNELKDQWSLVFFGFTHCPDICPATLQQLAIANRNLQESGMAVPEIVLVSVDPERDTPDALATYVSIFPGEIRGVTGDIGEITKLTSSAGIFFEKSESANDDYSVDHSAAVLVINEDASIHASFGAPHSIDSLVNDLPILMGSD
jgi:protein SCO1/2